MQPMKAEKRKTSAREAMAFLVELVAHCAPDTNMEADATKRNLLLVASELSIKYPPSVLNMAMVSAIAPNMRSGRIPDVAAIFRAIEAELEKRPDSRPSILELADFRLKDPAVSLLTLSEKLWISRWDRMIGELRGGGDPKWDDIKTRHLSKRFNMASCMRTHAPRAWRVVANPFHASYETSEAQFIRDWYNEAPSGTHRSAAEAPADEEFAF